MTFSRCLAGWVALLAPAPARAEEPLTTARQVRELAVDRAAAGLPVALTATIVRVVRADQTTTVFLQDDTGGTFLTLGRGSRVGVGPAWAPGVRVRVHGATHEGLYVPGVRPTRVDVLGRSELPAPARLGADELASGRWHYQWVEVEGTVLGVASGGPGSAVLRLRAGSGAVEVRVDADPPADPLVEARVRVRGLAAGAINARRQLIRAHVSAPDFRDVVTLAPPDPRPFAPPAVAPDQLMRYDPGRAPGRRVKVCGVVTAHRPGSVLCLRDGDNALLAEAAQADPLDPGARVEVLGFVQPGPYQAVLTHAEYRRVGTGTPPEPQPVTPEQLRGGRREADLVRLDATVVEAYPGVDGDVVALRAGESRFLARCPVGVAADLSPGCEVSVTGICRAVEFAEGDYRLRSVGFEVWPRSADDLRVVSRPSWWTRPRLGVALAVAVGVGALAFAWVAVLHRQVRR